MKPLSTHEKDDTLFHVLDVETTQNRLGPNKFGADPMCPDNYVVALGLAEVSRIGSVHTRKEYYHSPPTLHLFNEYFSGRMGEIVSGHNLKFDLKHVRKHIGEVEYREFIERMYIWDTQIGEYVLSGQLSKITSLNKLAAAEGIPLKDTEITKAFEMGMGAEKVDKDKLMEYLDHDLIATGQVAYSQMQRADAAQFNLIIQMGEALKAIVEMEWNGMHVDCSQIVERIDRGISSTEVIKSRIINNLERYAPEDVKHYMGPGGNSEFYNSPQALSCYLFGGKLEYTIKHAMGLYKSGKRKGQVRYANKQLVVDFRPKCIKPSEVGAKLTKRRTRLGSKVYSVDEDVLTKLLESKLLSSYHGVIVQDILELKKISKVVGTYYCGFDSLATEDGIVHHTLNQTIAATGRWTCTRPNLQNTPMATEANDLMNVKNVFTSRWHQEGGCLVEVDLKQLEVCALAHLTRDPQLIDDIRNGRDIHTEMGKSLGKARLSKQERRDVKSVVFAMIYGAGSRGIAKSTGLDEVFVKGVMDAFYKRYSTVKDFYKELEKKIEAEGYRMDLMYRGDTGPEHYFEWQSKTGRKYMFTQDRFRPGPAYTQVRNYPVQGTATGDIVPCLVAEVHRVLKNEPALQAKLVNSVHDSIVFDCRNATHAAILLRTLHKHVFTRMDEIINEAFPDLGWDIPLEVEVEVGNNWGDMKEVDMSQIV